MLKTYFLLFFLLFFNSCSIKNYEINQSKIIIIKSPKIKFADMGYIRHSGKSLAVELFVAGKAIEKIEINHLICVSAGCMSKSGFNEDYLSPYYPSDILQNIILGREIYDGKNKIVNGRSFTQVIQTPNVNIKYKVTSNATFFKDKANGILFKIKEINQ